MKNTNNTRGTKIAFGCKVAIQIPRNYEKETLITISARGKEKLVSFPLEKIVSNRTVNFNDQRKQEAYKRINEKFREG